MITFNNTFELNYTYNEIGGPSMSSNIVTYKLRKQYIPMIMSMVRALSCLLLFGVLRDYPYSLRLLHWQSFHCHWNSKLTHFEIVTPCGDIALGPLRWRHNGCDSVSNHQPYDCLLNRLFRRRSKKTSKLRVTGLCAGIHRGPVNFPHKWPVTRKMFPFDDVIIQNWLGKWLVVWWNQAITYTNH